MYYFFNLPLFYGRMCFMPEFTPLSPSGRVTIHLPRGNFLWGWSETIPSAPVQDKPRASAT